MNTHEVKQNENIYDIAQFYYGLKELGNQLAETNGYSSPKEVKVGDTIKLNSHIYGIVPNSQNSKANITLKMYPVLIKQLNGSQINEIHKHGWGYKGIEVCFDLAELATKSAAKFQKETASLLDMNYGIGGVWEEFPNIPENQHDIKVNPSVSKNFIDYLIKCIDEKLPVLVGVNAGHKEDINDKVTDHFVVVYGYRIDLNKNTTHILAIDNACSNTVKVIFNVSDDFKISKPTSPKTGCSYTDSEIYVMTQIRVWKDIQPKTKDGVWGRW